jgi:hypothetical protein
MKHLILSAAMLFAASASQAKVICNVNSSDPKQDMVFDRVLFSSEVTSPHYLIVSKDAQSAQEVQINQFDNFAKLRAINGQTMVTLSQQENGQYAITVGHVDVTKGKTNALPLDAMAFGAVTDQQFLDLIVPAKNLSIICTTLK